MLSSRSAKNKYSNEMTQILISCLKKSHPDFSACMHAVLAGADPNAMTAEGETLLHIVLQKGKYDCIPELLEHGADPCVKNRTGLTSLQLLDKRFFCKKDFQFALAFIRYGANPNTILMGGKTLLHKCMEHYEFELMDEFLQAGVNPGIKDEAGKTPLQYLLRWPYRRLEAVKLVCAGADLKTTDEEGRTLEGNFLAAKKDLFEFVATEQPELLLPLQARNLLPDNPDKIIKILLDKDQLDIVIALLFSYNAPKLVNSKNEAILQACLPKNPLVLLSLFKMGYDPTEVVEGQSSLVKQLLSNDCQINKDDRIQLALACMQHGADINTTNEDNQTVLDIIYLQYPLMIGELEQYAPRLYEAVKPEDIFRALPIPDLRLQLKYLTLAHQAQNNILNFLILLMSNFTNDDSKQSVFAMLPMEVIAHIISFLPLEDAKRSLKDALELMSFIYNNVEKVKKMLSTPGGVNVCQRQKAGHNTFVLFKSAENCSQYYHEQKIQAQSWFQLGPKRKESPMTEKREQGLNCWKEHLSVFNNLPSRLALLERIEDTEFYREIKAVPPKMV